MNRPEHDPAAAVPTEGATTREDAARTDGPGAVGRLRLEPGATPLPDYTLVSFLGRGGFGEVWKATGPGGYAVALKFVPLGEQAGAAEERSAELLKAKDVRHPHLLGLFGAWRRDDVLILAMELADGTLAHRLNAARQQKLPGVPFGELLEYMREAAKGLDHLHAIGVQHRDVKPQNLLLVGGGVKVADFGLAKVLEHTSASNTGSMTPAYAAPEFLEGRLSPHSDQYSLAVAYCQLRGGRLPFAGGPAQVMMGHLTGTPDLATLPESERPAAARALAKDPHDRWPSCRDFVEALALAASAPTERITVPARPVAKRPPSRRFRPVWVVAAGVLLSAAVVAGILYWMNRPPAPVHDAPPATSGELVHASEAPSVASAAKDPGPPPPKVERRPDPPEPQPPEPQPQPQPPQPTPAAPGLESRIVPIAPVTLDQGQTRVITVSMMRGNDGVRVNDVQLGALPPGVSAGPVERLASGKLRVELTAAADAAPGERRVTLTAQAADGRTDGAFSLTVRAAPEAAPSPVSREPITLRGHDGGVWCAAFSHDGRTVATASQDKTVKLWDAATGKEKSTLTGHDGSVICVAFGPGDKTLATGTGGYDRMVRVWDPAAKTVVWKRQFDDGVLALAFDDGGRLAVAAQKTTAVCDPTGAILWKVEADDGVRRVRFSPDGRYVAGAKLGGNVVVYDAHTGKEAWRAELAQQALCLTYRPDGEVLAAGLANGGVQLLDAHTGRKLNSFPAHNGGNVSTIDYRPDGQYLVTGSADKTLKVWDTTAWEVARKLEGHDGAVYSAAFSPDGKRLVSASLDKTAILWDVDIRK